MSKQDFKLDDRYSAVYFIQNLKLLKGTLSPWPRAISLDSPAYSGSSGDVEYKNSDYCFEESSVVREVAFEGDNKLTTFKSKKQGFDISVEQLPNGKILKIVFGLILDSLQGEVRVCLEEKMESTNPSVTNSPFFTMSKWSSNISNIFQLQMLHQRPTVSCAISTKVYIEDYDKVLFEETRHYDDQGVLKYFTSDIYPTNTFLINDSHYSLFYNTEQDMYLAGCRYFTRDQAIHHWLKVLNVFDWDVKRNARANRFLVAIRDHSLTLGAQVDLKGYTPYPFLFPVGISKR